MTLDVLIATFERPRTLARALDSLLSAPVPDGLTVHVTVVQNDDSAATAAVLEEFVSRHPGRVTHLREPRRGKSHAINRAICSTRGDLVGIIDDDEEIDTGWYAAVAQAFAAPHVDFVGGPCLPRWGAVPPVWLPLAWRGVIGFVDDGADVMVFGQDAPGILMGGNAVIRRTVLARVGDYSPLLGPHDARRLFTCEDEELYLRLLAAGAHGLYVPAMKIYHYVPPQRLTKRYYRRWSFWHGVSRSVLDRMRPLPVARIARVPRYLLGSGARALLHATGVSQRDASTRFAGQLAVLNVIGFLYGRIRYRREVE